MKNFITTKALVLFLLVFISSSINTASAQIRYTDFETKDGIEIEYRWQRENIFIKDSRNILNLRMANTHDYHVMVEFSVGFYQTGIIAYESPEKELCFKPGQRKRGRWADIRFQSEAISKEDIESDAFDWDFINFEVKQVEECP